MNQRIRELVERTGGDIGTDLEFAVVFGELEDFEKFVQLLVRECAEIARLNTRVDSKVYLMIQEHFGVEQ